MFSEGGRPRVLRRNDRLGSQGVLSGFSWVLMGTHGFSVGTHGFSWVLSGYSDCAFLGSQGVLRQAPPLWAETKLYMLTLVKPLFNDSFRLTAHLVG